MKNFIRLISVYFLFSILLVTFAEAASQVSSKKKGGKGVFLGGSLSAGLGYAITNSDQTGINTLIGAAKAASNSTASTMGSATEYVGYITFGFAGNLVAIQLRPTLFTQTSSGSGSDGAHNYELHGFTLFPLIRYIPLSNDIIDFYIQGGLGYGKLDGSIQNGAAKASFSGSSLGTQIGIGASFCFVPDHCFNIEGNYRYLPLSRNIVSSGSGIPSGTAAPITDRELEDTSGMDIATTLSGISGMLGYTYNF